MKLKIAAVSPKNWNLSECMSAKRFVRYTPEEFKHVTRIQDISKKFCDNLTQCHVKKCNLKKAIKKYQHLIVVSRITSQKAALKNLKQRLGNLS